MTINGSTNNSAWTYKLEATETGTSLANRTSTVMVKAYLGRANSQSYLGGNYSVSVTCAGQTQTQSGNIAYPTYINGGAWLELKTFTFTVSNTGNPTTINISSSFSSGDFTPSSASASGSMQLTVLHLSPEIGIATMAETNAVLTALSIPDTTIVRYLSKKTITLSATAYDSATLKYRLRHFNTDYALPSATTFQNSASFSTDYTAHDIMITDGKAQIIQDVGDSLNGLTTDWVYVTISGTNQKPNGIAYTKPNLERTSTGIKRKSGNGTNLTDNKAELNLVGNIYKENDLIGNNNSITQIGYKIWEDGTSEPANYTLLTPTISGGSVTVGGLEISNIDFTKIYNYKIILTDNYGYSATIDDGVVPLGQATWSEYADRVDFLKITVGSYNPFEYSETETICGIWSDGINEYTRYRKVINIGNLPNDNSSTTAHNISNLDHFTSISGIAIRSSDKDSLPIPYVTFNTNNIGGIVVYANNTNVIVSTSTDRSAYTGYIVLEYTKTTN